MKRNHELVVRTEIVPLEDVHSPMRWENGHFVLENGVIDVGIGERTRVYDEVGASWMRCTRA